MTTNVVECKDCAYSREANTPNAVFCMLNHQTFLIPVYGCTNGRPGRIVPQTNADRIRTMSDEELAEFMKPYDSGCPRWNGKEPMPCSMRTNCRDCWLDWLKQEVDNG